jgi:hypothetical protein
MSNAIFPALPGLAGRLSISDEYDNIIYRGSNGYETRVPKLQDPMLRFKIEYILKDGYNAEQTFEPIRSFFRARRGSYESFLLDASVITGRASDANVTGQALNVDGTYYSPIIHTVSGYDESIYELHSITVKENGVTTPTTKYELLGPSPKGNYNGFSWPGAIIHFQNATNTGNRAPTVPVTANFSWYYRVRFANDTSSYDALMAQLYELNELELVTARDL